MIKTILAIILFGLAFKASANGPVKRPGELPVLPDGKSANDEEVFQAHLDAEKFLLQAEAYLDSRVMSRRQHEVLAVELEKYSENLSEH
jgi:hypothetical protein